MYAALYGEARNPCTLEMFMIRPQPFSYIPGNAFCARRKGASCMSRIIIENFSGGNSSMASTCWTPALFTRTSVSNSKESSSP
jgi:hypothetical protein